MEAFRGKRCYLRTVRSDSAGPGADPLMFLTTNPLTSRFPSEAQRDVDCVKRYAAGAFILMVLAGGIASGIDPEGGRQEELVAEGPDLNITGIDIANHSVPAHYAIHPTPIDLKLELPDTLLAAAKGEMASGPRTIGFTADPIALALMIIGISAGIAGFWHLATRRPEEEVVAETEDRGQDEG